MNTEIEKDIQNDYFPEKKIEESMKAQKAQEMLRIFRANQKTPIVHLQSLELKKDPEIYVFSFSNNIHFLHHKKERTTPKNSDSPMELNQSKLKK